MNPFYIQPRPRVDKGQTTISHNASSLLSEYNYNPAVKEQLLAAAVRAQANDVSVSDGVPHFAEDPRSASDMPMAAADTVPNMHREIVILPQFMAADIFDEYLEYIQQVSDATTEGNHDNAESDLLTVDVHPIKDAVTELMQHAVRDVLNPFYNVSIKDSELPQLRVYSPGGEYKTRVDGEALLDNGKGQQEWQKCLDRDITMYIYLNDTGRGGELVFPNQAITITPQKGLLVAFPSTHHFAYGAQPIISGFQAVLVNWFSLGD